MWWWPSNNVWTLALRLGVPIWVEPLVAPAVDLSILGLLLGTRHLALHGATPEQLRPACRLLIFASVATLALNVSDPIVTGDYGKAACDSVGPLLLIGWAEVGPGLLQAIAAVAVQPPGLSTEPGDHQADADAGLATVTTVSAGAVVDSKTSTTDDETTFTYDDDNNEATPVITEGDLLQRARQEDARHRARYQRPISAETLRIGAARSRTLVSVVRAEQAVRKDRPLATARSVPGRDAHLVAFGKESRACFRWPAGNVPLDL